LVVRPTPLADRPYPVEYGEKMTLASFLYLKRLNV
jgi:hypothetical protein